jgi:carbon-monoxide dehydrogenase medium subunit
MYNFRFCRPVSLAEAKAAFDQAEDAAFVAGGHTLLPTMKNRLAAPTDLIELVRLPELKGILSTPGALSIGAAETHAVISSSEAVRGAIPALAELAGSIGDMQVRNLGTLGGSIANNDPAADYPAALLALDATIFTTSRELGAADFFKGMFITALGPGEIITRVVFPIPQSAGYAKMRNPASRYAMAAAFVARCAGGVRVAITGAGGDGVFRWTAAEEALRADFSGDALDGIHLDPAGMLADIHGSAVYRAHLVAACARGAVKHQGGLILL